MAQASATKKFLAPVTAAQARSTAFIEKFLCALQLSELTNF
jgi:hypothetical protein